MLLMVIFLLSRRRFLFSQCYILIQWVGIAIHSGVHAAALTPTPA